MGRAPDSQIVIVDNGVSRRHAVIQRNGPGEYWLLDLESRNGTFLNGRRIVMTARLRNGDIVRIGDHSYTFHLPASEVVCTPEKNLDPTLIKVWTGTCWLLLADIKRSTELLKGEPTGGFTELLNAWIGKCDDIIQEKGGQIDKYLGDGFLAYWQYRECTAADIAHTLEKLRELHKSVVHQFRVAVHLATTTLGSTLNRVEQIMPGQEVNFIFALEELAGRLDHDFCFSAAAHSELASLIPLEQIPEEQSVRGFDGKYAVYRWT